MNKKIGVVIGVVALVLIAGGIYTSMDRKNNVMMANEQMEQKAMQDQKMTDEKAMMEKDAMMKADATKTDSMMKVGSYEAYSPEKVMMASATHDIVLFFRASWCPTCISLDKDIKANLGNIPSSLTILDVNYDNSKDLKQKYGVTYQHTFVQVDTDGTMIKKWSGSPTLSALVSEVK